MARPTPPRIGGSSSPMAFLKTRQGQLVAGGAGVLVVIMLAMRRGSGGSSPPLEGSVDRTLQDRLDQVGLSGGTLEGLISSTDALAGSVDQVRDLLEAQKPIAPTTPSTPSTAKKLASGAKWVTVPGTSRRVVVVPRAISKPTRLSDIARQVSVSKQPAAIASTLAGLYRLNPRLRGKQVVSNVRIVVPDIRYYGS